MEKLSILFTGATIGGIGFETVRIINISSIGSAQGHINSENLFLEKKWEGFRA
ncbi:MAG: hypothetical protein PF518_16730 [Spirochaetaceae bacterium]|nr:hypothetical protein [Spirochaetaceae bacterium]